MVWQSWKKTFQYQDVTAITGTKEIGFIVYNNETYIETIRFEEQKDVMKLYGISFLTLTNEKNFSVTHIRKTLTFLFKLYFVFSQTCEESSKGL